MISREIVEGTQRQGEDEIITYSLTTTPWGSTPSAVTVVAKDLSNDGAVVTSTVFPGGSASVVGDIITLAPLRALTAGHRYRIEVKFASGANNFEAYFFVLAEE